MRNLLIAVLLVVAAPCFADVARVGYQPLRAVPATAQSLATTAESTTWGTTPVHPKTTLGNPLATAFCTFSNASATVTVTVGLYFKSDAGVYTFLGHSKTVTVTASGALVVDAGGRYIGTAMPSFDTYGAPYYDLRIGTPSAGDVTIKPWVYGMQSQ